jgi:hypothetical protein
LGSLGSARQGDRLRLGSYKIRFADRHIRAMPEGFPGPGVDLRGEEADRLIDLAKPMVAWLEAREPGIVMRSLSVDRAKQRVLVTLEQQGARPRALRFDPPSSTELIDAGAPVERAIAEAAAIKIANRGRSS